MQALRITPAFFVADQIDESDIEPLAAAGVKCVICNRPDSEGGTPSEKIRAACERHGIKFFFQPVEFAKVGVADGDAFGQILQQCDGLTLAYCRTGRRTVALWALAAAPLMGVPAVLQRVASAGMPLEELAPLLARSAERPDPSHAPSSDPGARERFTRLWIAEG
ncbi:MAG TPA: TIGR01244 family sulfur transferase [Burkholderiaceae bacterium]|nr:TIGR01244 family sulfur transferase [Burkholderiaceae bacterium]